MKSLGLGSGTLQEGLKFVMRCVWVQFLNYLLSLIMPVQTLHLMSPLGFELCALTVTWETDDISLSTQCLGFFTPRSHGKASATYLGV